MDDEPVHPGGYYLIEGQHGCGKTTILKRALVESGPGILYVPLGVDGDVSVSLYEALKINMYCKGYWAKLSSYLKLPSEICHDDPLDRLKRVFTAVQGIARGIIESTSGILTTKEYRSFIEELDEKDLQLINNLNIFLINPQEVSFHSRLTKLCFESLFKRKDCLIVRLK